MLTVSLYDEGLPIAERRRDSPPELRSRLRSLAARQKRRFKRTTDSTHAWPVVPNLAGPRLRGRGRQTQKWSADISYIWTAEG